MKKSGDAWRIVMDSCLPVFHLIDTHRSIPYAIKEIQELLGISCVFEQAVQVQFVYQCPLVRFFASSYMVHTYIDSFANSIILSFYMSVMEGIEVWIKD